MGRAVGAFRLAICLAALSVVPAFTQTTDNEGISNTTSAAPVAYVYVQTNKGVNLYDAAANGKLTMVKGSPFKTSGEMIGSNGKYFITLGTFWVHVYPVESNGAIGKQVSTINTQDYDGAACGSTSGATLDHTGQSLYVLHYNAEDQDGNGICAAYQTFNIAKPSGKLTFNGAAVNDTTSTGPESLLTFTGNDKFAYAIDDFDEPTDGTFYTGLTGFARESNGALKSWVVPYFNAPTPPVQNESLWQPFPTAATTDPTNHVAITYYPVWDPPKGVSAGSKLGSFTADSTGNLTTTNTWDDMPDVGPGPMKMSPAGNLLAISGGGLAIYHFNGAHPIKPYKTINVNEAIGPIQWDKTNHLFALGTARLYVYTITPTSLSEAPGSPFMIPGLVTNSLVVVPR